MTHQNSLKEQLKELTHDEKVHSEAYQLFLKQKDSNDYEIKREGYRDDLLDTIYPEERQAIESMIVSKFEQKDIDVLKFMAELTTVDGISLVEEQYKSLSKQVVDMPNLAEYLYIHTRQQMYLDDLREYCLEGKAQFREEAIRNLNKLVMDIELAEISQIYEVSRTIILKENDSELLFWGKALMRKCIKRLDIKGDNQELRQLWEEVEKAIKVDSSDIRKEKLLLFEERFRNQ